MVKRWMECPGCAAMVEVDVLNNAHVLLTCVGCRVLMAPPSTTILAVRPKGKAI